MYGLEQLIGKKNISFDMKPFAELDDLGNDMRFVVYNGDVQKKIFIHANDSYRIKERDYKWCDVYGCVNTNYKYYTPNLYPKLISLVPSFGIRKDSLIETAIDSVVRLFQTFPYVLNKKEWNKAKQQEECKKMQNIKRYFTRRYKAWKNRLPYLFYNNESQTQNNYVYFLSTLWYNDEWNKNDDGVNQRRANFIRACKSTLSLNFEGGLLGDEYSSNIFNDVLVTQREVFSAWIEKTKRSILVFNTPAFWDCHGWKLGEYLAMGKCIISTELSNDLPYPLEHGVNIHFVENSEIAIKEAVEYIMSHPEYQRKLEQGTREYWEKYGTPEASIKLLGIE
jgi:glycosyltransferase involved in cell wall biosynthesis